jgi:hypothetical protein
LRGSKAEPLSSPYGIMVWAHSGHLLPAAWRSANRLVKAAAMSAGQDAALGFQHRELCEHLSIVHARQGVASTPLAGDLDLRQVLAQENP